jgi:predicted PurR-regulated permease PerM
VTGTTAEQPPPTSGDQPLAAESDGRRRAAESAVIVLALLASIAALAFGRDVFIPFALALVVATVLRPVVQRLERLRLPAPAAAVIVVIGLLAVIGGVGTAIERPLQTMAAQVPTSIGVARQKLDAITARIRSLGGTQQGRGSSAQPDSAAPRRPPAAPTAGAQPAGQSSSQPSGQSGPGSAPSPGSALGRVFGVTTSLLAEIVEEVLLVFFLLAAGRQWMAKLGRITASPGRERLWPSIAGEMHDVVARYLVVTTLINLGQAAVIALALWAIGIKSPLLWGALTFVAEFVPYLGGIVMIGLLLVAGLSVNQGFVHAILAPGIYLVVTTLQNNLVSPLAYGRGLRLNPTMILLGVMFWWMVWGVAGAFLAVPILASLRVLGSRLPALEPLAILLEE